jgi:DNA modification methylase
MQKEMKLGWRTEKRLVKDSIPTDYNPRVRDEQRQVKLSGSIEKFNPVETPVINLDNHIIAGQRRWEVYMESGRGQERIDVRVPNRMLTEEEVKEYSLLSNTHAGKWDLPKLELHFADLYKEIVDLPSVRADLPAPEIPDKSKQVEREAVEDGFCDAPPAEPVTKTGDLYEANRHRFICADSTDPHAMGRLMDGRPAQMVFTDPPYNVSMQKIGCTNPHSIRYKHSDFQMAAGEMNGSRFTRFLEDCMPNLVKYSENGSIHYICMDRKHIGELTSAGKLYTQAKQLIVWKKDNAGMGTFYRSQHELIFVYKNGRKKHINNFEPGKNGRYRTNIWEYTGMNSIGSKDRELLDDHPTVKPVKLVADAILDCSNTFGIILDPFLGSGTTLLAAEQTNRICYGVEVNPKYCDLIIRRYLRFMRKHNLPVTIRRNGQALSEVELEAFEK